MDPDKPETENSGPKKRKPASKKIRGKNGGARPGAGRNPYEFTNEEREWVLEKASNGTSQEDIAVMLRDGIAVETLVKHFPKELKRGKAITNDSIGNSMARKAMKGDVAAGIWWTKTQMGWTDKQVLQHTGPEGEDGKFSPIRIEIVKTKKGTPLGD